ncbi:MULTISPECIES: hypothetical protein [unclassified Nocardioides]|uniref:hypothetical protein n=1 Tax=unclassified Nocardioides TaxID=2615069 RepID=UPI000A80084E|nr:MULTISPECIES: hypothetical protein [unclassified Nocardioides]
MKTIGTRFGILCIALSISLSACAGSDTAAPDRRTPPADQPVHDSPAAPGSPTTPLGDLAGRGSNGF